MNLKIKAQNQMAQVLHRATGNPVSTLPSSAISNCFPGLEFDWKNFWRRAFVGIVLLEWDNYVIEIEEPKYEGLLRHRLLKVEDRLLVQPVTGPVIPGGAEVLLRAGKPDVVTMEWSNALAFIRDRQGRTVTGYFTKEESIDREGLPSNADGLIEVELTVRPVFDGESAAPTEDYLKAGELTQGLCSPWQHDYRECSCYYWPASRPDYVNIEATADGVSQGDNWLAKTRSGEYVLDNRRDSRLVTYDDLFSEWEKSLHFQIRGRDAEQS